MRRGRQALGNPRTTQCTTRCLRQAIVEGLAPFYTEASMDRVRARSGDLKATCDALLPFQSRPYSCHRNWAKDSSARGEIVCLGMVAARRHGLQKYEAFENGLTDAGGLLERDDE